MKKEYQGIILEIIIVTVYDVITESNLGESKAGDYDVSFGDIFKN